MTFAVFIISVALFVIAVISHFYFRCEMTVTEERIYGKSMFGKMVELPLSKAISLTTSAFSGICLVTAAGKIKFMLINNRDEVYKKLSSMIDKDRC